MTRWLGRRGHAAYPEVTGGVARTQRPREHEPRQDEEEADTAEAVARQLAVRQPVGGAPHVIAEDHQGRPRAQAGRGGQRRAIPLDGLGRRSVVSHRRRLAVASGGTTPSGAHVRQPKGRTRTIGPRARTSMRSSGRPAEILSQTSLTVSSRSAPRNQWEAMLSAGRVRPTEAAPWRSLRATCAGLRYCACGSRSPMGSAPRPGSRRGYPGSRRPGGACGTRPCRGTTASRRARTPSRRSVVGRVRSRPCGGSARYHVRALAGEALPHRAAPRRTRARRRRGDHPVGAGPPGQVGEPGDLLGLEERRLLARTTTRRSSSRLSDVRSSKVPSTERLSATSSRSRPWSSRLRTTCPTTSTSSRTMLTPQTEPGTLGCRPSRRARRDRLAARWSRQRRGLRYSRANHDA